MKLRRNKRGSVSVLPFIALVPLLAAIGGFAVDCMHVNDARGELQRATDAAALAGAQDLANYDGSKLMTANSVDAANEEPVNFALQVASLNAVDGPLGVWHGGQRTVTATIRYDASIPGPPNRPNRCDVTGSVKIDSFFAQCFGNFGQTVNSTSSAAFSQLNTLYSYMPLLVSINDLDPNGRKLEERQVGDEYTVIIKDNKASNSVWILNSNKDLKAIIEHIADPVNNPGVQLPPVKIGDIIKSDNGMKSAGKLFDQLMDKDVAFLITGDSIETDYLAKGKPEHPVIGFMVMHVTQVDDNAKGNGYSLTGILKPAVLGGEFDPFGTTSQVSTYAPFLARLVQ